MTASVAAEVVIGLAAGAAGMDRPEGERDAARDGAHDRPGSPQGRSGAECPETPPEGATVSGLWQLPDAATACFVFAHGAGAGMRHPFMSGLAADLAALGVATLRYQFPYMERGGRRVDQPAVAHATVRAAVAAAVRLAPSLPLFAGGKSFGGRMTSQAQAALPLPGVSGLCLVGFPLHPAGKPSADRARHLIDVDLPMLFLQGTTDELATLDLLAPAVAALGRRARLVMFEEADHAFHVPARTGRRDADLRRSLAAVMAGWMTEVAAGPGGR